MAKIKLMIDAGHGLGNTKKGKMDPGAVADGSIEAVITNEWALTGKFLCEGAGIEVAIIRDSETDQNPVGSRDDEAEREGCTHYISIHCNSSADPKATGTETLYRDARDKAFAKIVHKCALETLSLRDRKLKLDGSGQHKKLAIFEFDGPCCLAELGFIGNAKDRKAMRTKENRIKFWNLLIAELKAL